MKTKFYRLFVVLFTLRLCLFSEIVPERIHNWGYEVDKIKLAISTSSDKYNKDDPIEVIVTLQNNNEVPVEIWDFRPVHSNFEIFVLSDDKRIVPNRHKDSDFEGSAKTINLAAQNAKSWTFKLNQLYDLEMPGVYVIYVSMKKPNILSKTQQDVPSRELLNNGSDALKVQITGIPSKEKLMSGNALFTIVDPKKPDDAAPKPAPSASSAKPSSLVPPKAGIVSSPNVMARPAAGSSGNALPSPSAPDLSTASAPSDTASKPGPVATVTRFLAHQDAESSGRWGKVAVLLVIVLAAFLFMRRST